jgi:hypothetical protein
MPVLKALSTSPGHNIQVLAAVPLPSLHSLAVRDTDLCYARFLQGYTQLKELSLSYTNLKGVGAVAQLTGLTKLELHPFTLGYRLFSASEQSELGSALAAISNLQCLHIDHAPPGPVTEALSQLTTLTVLCLMQQRAVPNPGPLALPSVRSLTFLHGYITAKHLVCIDAPQLWHMPLNLALKPSDLPDLLRLCRGMLRACSSLSLNLDDFWSDKDTIAVMTVLHQDWQPSAEALCPLMSGSGSQVQGSASTNNQWSLALLNTHCSRKCLSLLPKGLNCLYLE